MSCFGKTSNVSLGPIPKGDLSFTYVPSCIRWKGLHNFFFFQMVVFSFPLTVLSNSDLSLPSAQNCHLLSPLTDLDCCASSTPGP